MKSLVFSTILLALTLTLLTGVAAAQETNPPSDDDVNAIAKQLYCPVCENIPLDVCGTQACAQWRELIREKLAQGWNEEQIKEYFVTQYGDRVLAAPPARGLNWLVYIVPPLAILVGVFILYQAFRAWRKPAITETEPSNGPIPASDDEYVARLEEELSKR
ncbi:MAG: cytochrome c-type biogenesis protein CcmH [Anaerolineales bacterium]|jgi:cytochrome c-type biogenesis protein CcmH